MGIITFNCFNIRLSSLICVLCLLVFSYVEPVVGQSTGQTTVVGKIIDAATREPIPFVTIVFAKNNIGATSDLDGNYFLSGKTSARRIVVSCMGYQLVELPFKPGQKQTIDISLKQKISELEEIVIKPKRNKYRNKGNPAVDIVLKVIDNKSHNRKEEFDYFRYEKYEKIQFALSNINEKFIKRKAFRKFAFVFENIDTIKLKGVRILPVFLKETISQYNYRKSPRSTKEVIKGNKMVNFEGYTDDKGMTEYLKYLYQDIDIYDNTVTFVSNVFLSPIAKTAPVFYKYFIQDTTFVDGMQCAKLFFSPRNKSDMLFQGFMYITLDSTYAVKRLEMSVNKDINLNWVKEVNIIQEFEKINTGWLLSTDEISLDFGISDNSMGVFGQRVVSYKDFIVNKPVNDSIFKGTLIEPLADANQKTDAFWESHRHLQLSDSEKGVYIIVDSIKKIPAFKRTMDIVMLIFSGYKDMGYFEIGPVNTFYSFNPIEGIRVRVGGRTTEKFSKKLNFETYLAYGFTDLDLKYYLALNYSLNNKTLFNFPVKSLKVSIQDETNIPGQELQFVQEDNFLLSIKRGENNKLLYNNTFRIEQLNEFENHFSYTAGYRFTKQKPAGELYFNPENYSPTFGRDQFINISEIYLNFRYAPNEQFYQGRVYRSPIVNRFPVLQLHLAAGSKFLNNDYNYQSVKFSIFK